jgi:hypothetical protein
VHGFDGLGAQLDIVQQFNVRVDQFIAGILDCA